MNKGQGFTAGALIVGAAILHPGLSGTSSPAREGGSGSSAAVAASRGATTAPVDGPWIASCNFWRPSGWTPEPALKSSPKPKQGDLDSSNDQGDVTWKLHVTAAEASTDCSDRNWGLRPATEPGSHGAITAVIATLPDPVHSSLALDFDRLVDVITQAAADNNYLVSYYWLPWTRPPESGKSPQAATAEEIRQAQEREKQPGLLILKPTDLSASDPRPNSASPKRRVIYMFLVGQTPALGVNGYQMRHALEYERVLEDTYGAELSIRDPAHGVDVIGPNNSGSADSLREALLSASLGTDPAHTRFHVVGTTSTTEAAETLKVSAEGGPARIDYVSFGEDTCLEQRVIRSLFSSHTYGHGRLALLNESGTAFGSSVAAFDCNGMRPKEDAPIVISFPREISLLRNAQREDKAATDAVSAADPYLHLSLKTSGTEDTIAHFSPELTPFSQEAQWMSIVRELKMRHVEVVSISASNILDELFLAKNIHRDLPDARVVLFEASDLLFARFGDNAPYLGTIATTAYPLVDLTPSNSARGLHDFASTWTEQFYNAVSYTLWSGESVQSLSLSSYDRPVLSPDSAEAWLRPPPLWMTVVGRDGYYPLSVVDPCSSNSSEILPVVTYLGASESGDARPTIRPKVCQAGNQEPLNSLDRVFSADRPSYPGFSWYVLCVAIVLLCITHTMLLHTASFWSPTTRDLAINWSDEPRRRAVYLHIATAMLFSISAVAAVPVFFTLRLMHLSRYTLGAALLTLAAGLLAVFPTLRRTLPFLGRPPLEVRKRVECRKNVTSDEQRNLMSEESLYPVFHGIALLSAVLIPGIWCALCADPFAASDQHLFLGRFFAYRCLYPASGVSPLIPVLLILFCWYLWAFFQTKRLRFSTNSRPLLPRRLPDTPPGLYVSEDALSACANPVHSCVFENVTCLLITRQLVRRALHRPGSAVNILLAAFYSVLFVVFVFGFPIQGLDHFLRHSFLHLTLYEFLISALFYPLLVVALTGSVRMLAIWTSLRGGLLEPLERSPLRFAFSRLTNVAWMTMFKQNGVFEYWRDMTRSNQSMRQMIHSSELGTAMASLDFARWHEVNSAKISLDQHIATLMEQIEATTPGKRRKDDRAGAWDVCGDFLSGDDLPDKDRRAFLNLMGAIECDYARFCEALLAGALIPYWIRERQEFVEAEPDAEAARGAEIYMAPKHIQLAEEFLALRYFSLIRAVLINVRQLMTFVSVSFVLALLAWNSYPFQPRQWIDWAFTALLFGLGAAVIWMFAQMHRNSILSRITGTQANELGAEFYLRLATFGAVPVLTWIASQFPAIGSGISRLLQSGLQVAK